MSFSLPEYHAPDFAALGLLHAPQAVTGAAPRDGVVPEGYHATTIFPEYFHVGDRWLLAQESRMDCVAVLTPEDFADDSAGGMMQEIKTGNRGGTIAVSVDRQTGNVLSATYDGVWVTAVHTMGNEMILPLRTQTDYVMAW